MNKQDYVKYAPVIVKDFLSYLSMLGLGFDRPTQKSLIQGFQDYTDKSAKGYYEYSR
jgi:hypothetical protein